MPRRGLRCRKHRSGLWEVRPYIRYPDGRKVRQSFYGRTCEEALKKAQEAVVKARMGLLPMRDSRTFQGFAEEWLERKAGGLSAKTLANYRRELGYWFPYLGPMRLQEVKPLDIRRALDELTKQGIGPRSLKKALEHLRAVFKEALALEIVHRDPTAAIRLNLPSRPKAGRALEPEEAEALLRAFDAWPTWEVGMALRLCLALGLREGEALGLKWGDVDLEGGTLTIRRAWTALGGKGLLTEPKTASSRRTLPVPAATLERLKARWEYLLSLGGTPLELKEAWVFPGRDPSRPLNPHSLAHALRKITARLGIPHLRVHDLRHSYGSFLLANGAPLELVSERMGHANPSITLNVYRHLLGHERQAWVVDPEDLLSRPRPKA
uniref:Site-specific integrase n=1 Tax=Thermus caliditerrae TaxID=1330700 RepID=A0A7C5VF04_9DEIN